MQDRTPPIMTYVSKPEASTAADTAELVFSADELSTVSFSCTLIASDTSTLQSNIFKGLVNSSPVRLICRALFDVQFSLECSEGMSHVLPLNVKLGWLCWYGEARVQQQGPLFSPCCLFFLTLALLSFEFMGGIIELCRLNWASRIAAPARRPSTGCSQGSLSLW